MAVSYRLIILSLNLLLALAQSQQKRLNLNSDINEAMNFAAETDRVLEQLIIIGTIESWKYNMDMSEANAKDQEITTNEINMYSSNQKKIAEQFAWREFETQNYTLYRWFKLFIKPPVHEGTMKAVKCKSTSLSNAYKSMNSIHSMAKVCPYKWNGKDECNLALEPDVNKILENSRNYDELAYYWSEYRNQTGKKIRPFFVSQIEPENAAARSQGFTDVGHMYRSEYESSTFLNDIAKLIDEVRPLYEQFHAFLRRGLRKHYKQIKEDGPIPASVLGDMNSVRWQPIYKLINPFKDAWVPNTTTSMLKLNWKTIDLIKIAEDFFVSLGMKKMTPQFWKNSVFEKVEDKNMVCHASAWDMGDGQDFRIKMCAEVNDKYRQTILHEMGHIQYFMHYAHLTKRFRESGNPGFTEGVGDVITLSSSTPNYLKQINLLDEKEFISSEKSEISYLLLMALNYVGSIPSSYIVDLYRYRVYSRDIKENELNRKWWDLKLEYQGICPPVERTEEDFDIGARYHIAFQVEYMRYFIANIFQFQLHKALCSEAGHEGPLFKCSIYKNKKAGKLFSKFMSYGRMRPWEELVAILTHEKSTRIEAGPLLEYFEPLFNWLKKENKGHFVGWKSNNSMKCP